MTDRWRYRCPEGHVTIHRRGRRADVDRYWYCDGCNATYDSVVDGKTDLRVSA